METVAQTMSEAPATLTRTLVTGILCAIFMAGCNADVRCLKEKTDEVRKRLLVDIKQGDDRAKAEMALKQVGAGFSFDEYQNRLGAIIRVSGCGPDEAIQIFVNLDDTNHIISIQVDESYTWF
jgi:hypothetical protein